MIGLRPPAVITSEMSGIPIGRSLEGEPKAGAFPLSDASCERDCRWLHTTKATADHAVAFRDHQVVSPKRILCVIFPTFLPHTSDPATKRTVMSLDITTRTLLEHYANIRPPYTVGAWCEPWINILTTLFP